MCAWELYIFFHSLKIVTENSFLSISLEDVLFYFSLEKAAWSLSCDRKASTNLEMQKEVQIQGALKLEI